jgi:hypothetical protein
MRLVHSGRLRLSCFQQLHALVDDNDKRVTIAHGLCPNRLE